MIFFSSFYLLQSEIKFYIFFLKLKYFTSVLFLHTFELRIWLLDCNGKQERISLTAEGPTLSGK